jgi:hypothetical protein
VEKATSMRENFGSPMTSMLGTSPNYASTHKTQQNQRGDRDSRGASSPASIPLSPSYFDVLSEEGEELEEENAPREKSPGQTGDAQDPQRAPDLSQDPRGKAQMSLTDQEAEREESDLQLVLHLSRAEARIGRKGETAQMSLTD